MVARSALDKYQNNGLAYHGMTSRKIRPKLGFLADARTRIPKKPLLFSWLLAILAHLVLCHGLMVGAAFAGSYRKRCRYAARPPGNQKFTKHQGVYLGSGRGCQVS